MLGARRVSARGLISGVVGTRCHGPHCSRLVEQRLATASRSNCCLEDRLPAREISVKNRHTIYGTFFKTDTQFMALFQNRHTIYGTFSKTDTIFDSFSKTHIIYGTFSKTDTIYGTFSKVDTKFMTHFSKQTHNLWYIFQITPIIYGKISYAVKGHAL